MEEETLWHSGGGSNANEACQSETQMWYVDTT